MLTSPARRRMLVRMVELCPSTGEVLALSGSSSPDFTFLEPQTPYNGVAGSAAPSRWAGEATDGGSESNGGWSVVAMASCLPVMIVEAFQSQAAGHALRRAGSARLRTHQAAAGRDPWTY